MRQYLIPPNSPTSRWQNNMPSVHATTVTLADPSIFPWASNGDYIGDWSDPELPLVGIAAQIANVLVWFGNKNKRLVLIEYPTSVVKSWVTDETSILIPFSAKRAVTYDCVHLSRIPEHWIRIRGSAVRWD